MLWLFCNIIHNFVFKFHRTIIPLSHFTDVIENQTNNHYEINVLLLYINITNKMQTKCMKWFSTSFSTSRESVRKMYVNKLLFKSN